MQYFPPALENLVEQFARLPGVGVKSAQRLAFHVLSLPEEDAAAFAQAILSAKSAIHCCPVCQNLTEGDGPCSICASPKRDASVICVVADPKDVVAMERAREVPELREPVSRMELHVGDSIEAMNRAEDSIEGIPDLVLLDPMFPERQKSALVKKKFQLIHRLESPCMEEETLLNAAIAAGPRKILIKRPLKGPWLAGRKPGYSISGKAVRYDCILLPRD